MHADPPRDAESRRALRALKWHLRASFPGAKFSIEKLPVSAPGWTLFASDDRDVRPRRPALLGRARGRGRGDEEPLAELVPRLPEPRGRGTCAAGEPEALSWIAVALLDRDQQLLDQRRYQQI
jgi:hypothetical protein